MHVSSHLGLSFSFKITIFDGGHMDTFPTYSFIPCYSSLPFHELSSVLDCEILGAESGQTFDLIRDRQTGPDFALVAPDLSATFVDSPRQEI